MSRQAWTEEQVRYLNQHYGYRPVVELREAMRKKFGVTRSAKAIEQKASRLGMGDRVPRGYVRLAWAHPHGWKASETILRAARRDGVLRRQGGGRANPWIAPEEWVDAFVEAHFNSERADLDREIRSTWYSTAEVGRMFEVPASHAVTYLLYSRTRAAKLVKNVRRHRITNERGQPYYWHPDDIRAAHAKWERLKLQPKGKPGWRWTSEDVQSVRCDANQEAA